MIMDSVPAEAYMMQTNGLLLDRLEAEYCRKFQAVLVSLDGDEDLTDYYRGKGTYRRVVENLKLFRSHGFDGELIARMTVDSETDIRQAVRWLLFNRDFPFESVHWQLDAQFWQSDYEGERVKSWFERYNAGVRALVGDWVSHMEASGKVLRIYPFIGVMESLLSNESAKLRCGAGWTEFNIQTDGNITPCPVMAGMKNFYLGNIWETDPKSLVDAVLVRDPCPKCAVYGLCGGRCLYANATRLWGEEGYHLVCGTVENLFDSLRAILPRIRQMILKGSIRKNDFSYPKYNSCEIIP
jgi:putative peptide-modifying radical SAM enzyme